MKTRTETTYEFRPLYEGKMLRYNGGDWIPDDGEYDLAFIECDNPIWHGIDIPSRPTIVWRWCKNMNWTAHVQEHPNGNAWHYLTTDSKPWGGSWDVDKHPNELANREASSMCCYMNHCANGRCVDFNITNDTIQAGLLREVSTKKIIKPPKIFKCCYCGEIDWKKEEKKKRNV